YALMQGYDAFALNTDVQVGGTDQLFNIVTAARKLMTFLGKKPNIAIIMGILPGTDGVIRMSKSLGNHIPILASPDDMYGKVMSLPDQAMGDYCRLVTRWSVGEIAELEHNLDAGLLHPRDLKMKLAYEIVDIFHGDQAANQAQSNFVRVFQRGDVPEEMDEYHLLPGQTVLDVLESGGLISSRGEGRRLIAQNGVRLDGETLKDPNQPFPHPGILQAGKRRFLRVVT
ncbi:MAG: tyrosine--tRNA ligase, partial [Anaerolineales bacterium]